MSGVLSPEDPASHLLGLLLQAFWTDPRVSSLDRRSGRPVARPPSGLGPPSAAARHQAPPLVPVSPGPPRWGGPPCAAVVYHLHSVECPPGAERPSGMPASRLRVEHLICRFQHLREWDFSDETDTDRLKVFRMVRVQPWLHLEGAQGTLLKSGGVILYLRSLPPTWPHHHSLGLSCWCLWVCNPVWAALPGGWLTRSHLTYGAWASLAAPVMAGRLLGHQEGLRQKPRHPSGDSRCTPCRAPSFCLPGGSGSGPAAAGTTVSKGFVLPHVHPRRPEIHAATASVECCL